MVTRTRAKTNTTRAWVTPAILALLWLPSAVGCTADPRARGLTASTYNYSNGDIIFVWLNGKQAGVGINPARPGDVTGGGSMCCIQLAPEWKSVAVNVQLINKVEYTVQAQIEQPWPEYPHYAYVHVLPGRKVVIEVTATAAWPRQDLMDNRLKELGIRKEHKYPSDLMNIGPAQ